MIMNSKTIIGIVLVAVCVLGLITFVMMDMTIAGEGFIDQYDEEFDEQKNLILSNVTD